jgi:predicted XRE-type DNA-binding protein
MASSRGDSDANAILRELEDIKRLVLLALLRSGISQADVAKALGVNQSSISRMFPGGAGKPAKTQHKRG